MKLHSKPFDETLLVYASDNLRLFKTTHDVILLQTNQGHFKTPDNQILGAIVKGIKLLENGETKIIAKYPKVIQVFPDSESWIWEFTEKGYKHNVE